ncbi:hypothetical protein RC55_16345 [Herbaspirillum seropedicae]|nr:hypothetical protein [Herbaspirillum seropedicae]
MRAPPAPRAVRFFRIRTRSAAAEAAARPVGAGVQLPPSLTQAQQETLMHKPQDTPPVEVPPLDPTPPQDPIPHQNPTASVA